MTTANLTGLIGATNDGYSTTALFPLGTVMIANGTDYVYVTAASALAAAATFAVTGTTTTAGTTSTHDVLGAGVPSGAYFFARKVASPF